ncbi:MAG: Mur ligase domain-containing protein [Rickettsiales bacterium]|jgi:UDP-N-acetylmuramate--alanine ligase|nr:Mur ligase domain-containing protein [Rickettsiales bacterium]
MKVHFIGINGSGCSGVAIVAKKSGFDVSGCDKEADTPYSAQLAAVGIPVFVGHDKSHVDDADIVAVSAAFLEQKDKVDEVEFARKAGKLMKWQEFLGRHILPSKRVIAVCGTHGKTTITSMVAHILESAGFDPTAFVGAIVPAWGSSSRFGASDWIVIEADEYAENFASFQPEIAVVNNLEMEHPEYFRDWGHYKQTFVNFLSKAKIVVYNSDDSGIGEIIDEISAEKISFSAKDFPDWKMDLIGDHNRSNAMAAVTVARKIGISDNDSKSALATFRSADHRLQKIFDDGNNIVYDDYAHHHTQVKSSLAAVRGEYPNHKIIAIFEPHQISRYVQNTKATLGALAVADFAVVVGFYLGREAGLPVPDVTADIKALGIGNIKFISDPIAATDFVKSHFADKTVVVVMGAGRSYKISEMLKKNLEDNPEK